MGRPGGTADDVAAVVAVHVVHVQVPCGAEHGGVTGRGPSPGVRGGIVRAFVGFHLDNTDGDISHLKDASDECGANQMGRAKQIGYGNGHQPPPPPPPKPPPPLNPDPPELPLVDALAATELINEELSEAFRECMAEENCHVLKVP